MPAGRPTDYNEEIAEKARQYLKLCKDKVRGTTLLRVHLPSIAGLAIYLKISRSSVYEWRDAHPEFADILEEILATQEQRLIENGLSGQYNPTIAKLALGKHGYSDKQEVTGKDGDPLFTDEHKAKSKRAIGKFLGGNTGSGK